jgi:Parvulin-like peptidyl-prolyl isomerase
MLTINKYYMQKLSKVFFALLFVASGFASYAQSQTHIDYIVAVVGKDIILSSDIEQRLMMMKQSGELPTSGDPKCQILEQMLTEKLLVNQARLDSIKVNNMGVESQVQDRIDRLVASLGSMKAVEELYKKTAYQIRQELRETVKDQALAQQMHAEISDKVTITPNEVQKFFNARPKDSLPLLPDQYIFRQIALYPPASSDAKLEARQKLLNIRERILKGEKFSNLAILYSQDVESAKRGGELGFAPAKNYVKPFADACTNLKDGQVSNIVETEYGFHIIQMIEHRGDLFNARHILIKPVFSAESQLKVTNKLDSIARIVRADSMTFDQAALRFSEDKNSRLNGGLIVNMVPYQTNHNYNTTKFDKDFINPKDYYAISSLKEGQISQPYESQDDQGQEIVKITKIERFIPTHVANLKDDFKLIQDMALEKKQSEYFDKWLTEKITSMYIKIDPTYANCVFQKKGWFKK